ncbi:hypothetical protein F5878DRAFT_719413 [Lentinula raphanica]|uniref:RING-type E3 ubiquitin transferase n=1 Tax=Lentinula raphanica TaxID=153919 RepID=A0AA38NZS2_9AGAR|nr:hypothetical protein F5878DRAFT_719413 [Lentinula raphanica]
MNAASKGHLPIVNYLLAKQNADPLVRNKWGETAYDVAAAVFEVWICAVLEKAEKERFTGQSYNVLEIHTTVPVIVYENQRLLAVDEENQVALGNGLNVSLPLLDDPFNLPVQSSPSSHLEKSHFWLSDWTIDITYPNVDVHTGWQYSRDGENEWVGEVPWELAELVNRGKGLPSSWTRRRRWVRLFRRRLDISPLPFLFPDQEYYWIGEDGGLVKVDHDSSLGPGQKKEQDYVERARYLVGVNGNSSHTIEPADAIDARRSIAKLERATAELRVGIEADQNQERKTQAEVLLHAYSRELDRQRASAHANGLSLGVATYGNGDVNADDEEYRDGEEGEEEEYDDDDDESFHYPTSAASSTFGSTSTYAASISQPTESAFTLMNSSPNFKNSKAQRPDLTHNNLSHHLSLAPDFRVPTHEAAPPPFSSLPSDSHAPYEEGGIRTSRTASISGDAHSIPTPHFIDIDNGGGGDLGGTIGIRVRGARWERDEEVSECRECRRRFGLLLRRHCRRCGKIFCDRCSSYRALLDPEDVVHEPGTSHQDAHPHHPAINRSMGSGLNRSSSLGSSSSGSSSRPTQNTHRSSSSTSSTSTQESNSNHGPAHDKHNHRLRVCQTCFEESTGAVPRALSRSRSLGLNTDGERVLGMGMERVLVQQGMLNVPSSRTAQMRRETSSQLSDLAECPVCSTSLDQVGTVPEQEAHVKRCLEGGGPGVSTGSGSGVGTSYAGTGPGKYLVYKLPKGSVLIGVECVICLEEFTQGSMIARLSCFCSFHNACLSSWLQRGKACPVHAR